MQHTDLLLERDGELARLAARLDDARAGRGGVVLLEGPPGIGKTRLSETARDRAREAGVTVLSARASELDRDFPFGVARQLFEPLLAGAGPASRERLLRGAASGAGAVLGPDAPAAAPGTDPSFAHFHALYWLVANLAEEAPAALFVDDLHWADASSLRFLQFLLPRLADLPVLLVLAARPAEAGAIDAIATDALTVTLRPGPLSDRAVSALVTTRLGDADGGFCDACTKATGGNPFLLRELLRELAADEVAPSAANVGLVRQLAPPTVARAVLLRLARLGDDAVAFARAVAVLGDDVPLRRAAALAAVSDDRAGEIAAGLARADILA